MQVNMNIRTNKDAPSITVSGSMVFTSPEGLDEFIKAVKIARKWLADQRPRKPAT